MAQVIPVAEGGAVESSVSAVSWGPIVAGAVVASAVSLSLLVLGSGLGLSVVSPWANDGASATTFAVSTGVWLIVMQWVSAALGGYMTGRLRTKWTGLHTDEVFFRDTAHGFLAWALSTLLVAGVMSSALSTAVGAGVNAVSTVASGAAMGAAASADDIAPADPSGYFIDMLFRPGANAAPAAPATGDGNAAQGEVARILAAGAVAGEIPADDRAYLALLVTQRTGLPQAEAEGRVNDVIARVEAAKTQAQEAADTARKAGVTTALVMFVSLILGAFIASVAAAFGGGQRDDSEALLVVR